MPREKPMIEQPYDGEIRRLAAGAAGFDEHYAWQAERQERRRRELAEQKEQQ